MESRTTYPLTTGEKLIFLAEKFTIYKQLMNIPTSCLLDTDLDLDMLKRAAEEAVQRNDAFGLRFVKKGKEIVQYFTERKVLTMEIKDFRGQTKESMEAFFYKVGSTKLSLYDKPLCKIYIIRSPEGKSGLFVCNSHLIMDSWAVTMFYKDVLDVYNSLKNNEPMPKPIPSYESILQKEIAYTTSEKHAKDTEFWNQEISGPKPIFTHVNGRSMLEEQRKAKKDPEYRFGKSLYILTSASHVVRMVEKEDVDLMKIFCQEYKIPSLQVLFYWGMRTTMARVNDREKDVSMYLIAARRATVEEKLVGGTRALSLPVRTIMEEDITFLDALNMIYNKQNELFRHADMDTMDIFAMQHKNFEIPQIETITSIYLSFQPVPLSLSDGTKVSTKWYCNGTAATSSSLTIMDGDGTGALRCYYEYLNRIIKPETLNEFHDFMIKVIKAGIANPQVPLKELLDLPVK